jgi:GNAT superfamily N-acetyltransferase
VATDGTTVVGWMSCRLNSWTSEAGAANLTMFVYPDHRGVGIGTGLLDAAKAHLDDIAARRVRVFATEDSLGFARAAGFEASRAMRYSGVDTRNLPPAPPTPPDLRLVSFAEVEPPVAYAADCAVSADEPGDMPIQLPSFGQWHDEIWASPALNHAVSVGVLDGPDMVAFAVMETDGDRAWSAMTGTLAGYRGRGLAKLAKSTALRAAAAAGVTTAFTSNDADNRPMLAINEWFGYRIVATEWSCVLTLS